MVFDVDLKNALGSALEAHVRLQVQVKYPPYQLHRFISLSADFPPQSQLPSF
jgi:hypothetical protein